MEKLSFELESHSLDKVKTDHFLHKLKNALIKMGPTFLKPEYQHLWSEENPTFGFCYVISECIYYLLDRRATVKVLSTPEGKHYFLELEDGTILDLAADRDYDYSVARRTSFGNRNKPSKRTQKLLSLLDFN